MRYKDEWVEYLEAVNEQKHINNLTKKLKNKKVLLYGAGMVAEVLIDKYDLSGLNIVGISDKKFEKDNSDIWHNIKTINPQKIKEIDFDIILFTLKEHANIERYFKEQNICTQTGSLIKKDKKFAIKK